MSKLPVICKFKLGRTFVGLDFFCYIVNQHLPDKNIEEPKGTHNPRTYFYEIQVIKLY